ncbi:MAG: hypothetical protein F6K22_10905 [Okeania sp. SIO2F4]|nr:hypothetical protein [Okeania sp. SIO2F4]NES03311.1 hypothetical protein [Okeania sp. SIO2F4]
MKINSRWILKLDLSPEVSQNYNVVVFLKINSRWILKLDLSPEVSKF